MKTKFRSIVMVSVGAALAATCIIPDKDIQVIGPCGEQWCTTIPGSGPGQAWGEQNGNQVQIREIVDGELESITRCVCMTPAESAVLNDGCSAMPCDPEFLSLKNEIVNKTYEACLEVAASGFNPSLSQNPAVVTGSTCLEATPYWNTLFKDDGDPCSVPIEECDTEAAAMGDGGEPYYTLMTACTSGTCTVPDSVLDAIDADPDLLMDSDTRLTQVSSGMQFSGIVQNSLAYRLGFRNGDTIQQVNGIQFRTTSDFLRVFQDLRVSEDATLQVLRGSNVINLDFQREQPWP